MWELSSLVLTWLWVLSSQSYWAASYTILYRHGQNRRGVPQPPALPPVMSSLGSATVEVALSLPELLGDVPFTLAPHILAMQAGFPLLPELLLSRDINDNLANFHYDFTLENSVLCDL